MQDEHGIDHGKIADYFEAMCMLERKRDQLVKINSEQNKLIEEVQNELQKKGIPLRYDRQERSSSRSQKTALK